MTVFADKEQLEAVMGRLFERIVESPEILASLRKTGLTVRFRYREPEAVLTFDFGQDPPRLSRDAGDADVEMAQSADVSHEFWLGRLSAVKAIATGRVRAKGDVSKALSLLPAIRPAFDIYPEVLLEMGLGHLVPKAELPAARRAPLDTLRRWLGSLTGRWGGGLDMTRLPEEARPPLPSDSAPKQVDSPSGRRLPTDPDDLAIEMLRRMHLIREFEEAVGRAWNAGEIPTSAIHLSVGQEAVAVGTCFALRTTDFIATTHRGHGHMLAKGAPVDRMMAEIHGRSGGLCGGKGGSMHVTDATIGAIGANGIVGASPLVAMGAALTAAYRKTDDVAVAFLGDGAMNQGMFHEAVNLAAVWKLPVLFVVENNGYGEFTSRELSTPVSRLSDRASGYGIPGVSVDGNDARLVFRSAGELVERARSGAGPAILECLTYRWHGHMEGDGETYRTEEEKVAWREKCPIASLSRRLAEEGVLDETAGRALRDEALQEIEAAIVFSDSSPEPALESLGVDVYAPEAPPEIADVGGKLVPSTGSAAINLAIGEEMERDPDVFLIGEDVSYGGYMAVTTGLVDRFGRERIRDTPISENAIVGGALGAAMTGLRPVAEILFSDFLTACMDPLVNQAAKLRYMSGGQYRIPLTVRTPGGAGLGMAAQHSQSLEALLMGIPGLLVAAPSTPRDCRALLKTAIRSDNPVLFFEHKLLYLAEGEVPVAEELLPFGEAAVAREGRDATVVALLYTVPLALEAAEILAAEGLEIEVIDPRTLVPLDSDTILASVARTRRLVTVEEGPVRHGWGAEVVARVASAAYGLLRSPPLRIGGTDNPIPYNKRLEVHSVPDAERVADGIRTLFRGRSR